MKVYYLTMLMLFMSSYICAFAQGNIAPGVSQEDWDAIQTQATSLLGADYQIIDAINVDSSLGNRIVADGAIMNPYNTLSACYIFTAREQNSSSLSLHGAVGIYKNGNVIWQSGPVVNASFCTAPSITTTRDLNNDGNVEIVTSWFGGTNENTERLWIFSWNGTSGNSITAVNDSNESGLISVTSGFEYVDVNGDNVYEITGDWYANPSDEQTQKIVYSWNGSQYGKWGNPPQPLPSGFYPRDKVAATIRVVVRKIGEKFSYQYILQSMSSSKQMINAFVMLTPPDSIENGVSPVSWDFGGVPSRALGWIAPAGFDVFIKPGLADSSFYFESNRLPAILQSLVRGDNGSWSSIFGDTIEYTIAQWLDEAISNSFKVKTVGPATPPTPFMPLDFLDTLIGYATQSRVLGWIKDQTTTNKYLGYFSSANTSLQQNNIASTRATLQQVLQDANVDSTANITSEAYALMCYNTEYLLAQLPTASIAGCNVKLINSTGKKLSDGALQYYEGGWKDAVNNNDGTFFVNTTATTISLRMTYEYGSQTKSNVTVGPDTVVFQTVNTQIQLQDSRGSLIDTGTVQYYGGAWRSLGTTISGVASKELLPGSYSFRMTYAYASKDKQQDLSTNPTVVFQTANAAVQLQNSQGNLVDQGTVQYYSGAWRDFGVTTNGAASKELLPNNYSFRMTYAFATKDKQQDIGANATVIFQTVNAAVQLQNSQGSLIDLGTVQYYSGAWRDFGVTTNGVATKELLPNAYSFRMTYGYASKDKQQDISANPIVLFQTVNAAVQLRNSQGNLIDQGTVQYYSGAWRTFGVTANGIAEKELLPNSYSFRMTYEFVSNDKVQDISANSTVSFSTVLCIVRVKDAQNQPVDGAQASYYSGAWRQIGATVNGEVTKELLPANLTFRIAYGTSQQDKTQNLSTNNVVEFTIGP